MKLMVLIVLTVLIHISLHSQNITEYTFYKDETRTHQTFKEKGRYVEKTTHLNDSVKTTEFRVNTSQELLWSAEFRKEKSSGEWHLWNWNYREFLPIKTLYRNYVPSGYYIFISMNNQLVIENEDEFIPPKFSSEDKDIIGQCDWSIESGFMRWMTNSIRYPLRAKENGVQGDVVVQFCIDKTGRVGFIGITQGVDKLIDDEAFRLISNLPQFIPAKLNGENIGVCLKCQVNFKLYHYF